MLRRASRRRPPDDLRTHLLLRFAALPMSHTNEETLARGGVRIELLNVPRLVFADRPPYGLERKDAALLALLAVEGPTTRARMASLLWPDSDPEAARNNLRQRLFRLRRAALADIVIAEASLRLADGVATDLADLDRQIQADLMAARGELLGGLSYDDCDELQDWVRMAREQWRVARRESIARRAAALESEGRIAPALAYAERLVADEPLLEHAHRRLIRLHYLRGDRAAALTAYERCKDLLWRELRALPGAETVDLAALVERSGVDTAVLSKAAPAPVALLRPPKLIGRSAEWAVLERATAERRTVLVKGEAGMGKTRLLGDFAARHGEAPMFGARPGDAGIAYALLAAVVGGLSQRHGVPQASWATKELARIAPELGAAPPSRMDPLRLRQAVAEAFAGWRNAGLSTVVLDDLHFADDATLDLLPALTVESRLTWLLGVRGGEMPASVVRWLDAPESASVMQLDLAPLDATAIEALLATLAVPGLNASRWATPLAQHTGGNPLFILETLLALDSAVRADPITGKSRLPVPTSVNELIARRLQKLSPAALRLARVAAFAGASFSAELAAAVLEQHALDIADAWRELECARFLRDGVFDHDLVRQTTAQSVPAPIAHVLHKAVAGYLEANAAPAARVAYHWREAQEWHKAAAQFQAAANASTAASRHAEAGDMFLQAAYCFEAAGELAEQHAALQEVSGSRIKAFDLQGARDVAQRLAQLAGDDIQRGWALDRLVDVLNMAREDDPAAQRAAEEMRRLGSKAGSGWMVFNATRKLAVALAHQGRFDDALAMFRTQDDWIATRRGEWNVHVWHCDHGYVLDLAGRWDEARAVYEHAEAIAERHENWMVVYAARRNLALMQSWRGKLCSAVELSDLAVSLSARLGEALVERNPRDASRRAALLRDAGRLAEALDLLTAAYDVLSRGSSPYWLGYCADQLAQLYLILGQPERAPVLLRAEVDTPAPEGRISRQIARARVARATGASAKALSGRALELASQPNCPARWRWLAQLEAARDADLPDALRLLAEVVEQAGHRGSPGLQLHALALTAGRYVDAGDPDNALQFACQAEPLLRGSFPVGMWLPEVHWHLYRSFAGSGAKKVNWSLGDAATWITQVAASVPASFRDSFRNRNRIHRTVLTLAQRALQQ